MNSRRTIILLVAVVVGAVASLGLLTYVRGLETEAQRDAELSEVWVVREAIPRGTPGETAIASNLIVKQQLPIEYRPITAITDPGVELANLVAVTDLPANATLVTGNFVTPSVITTGITDRLEERGMVSFTMTLDQVRGAGYMIQPGDFVNILMIEDGGLRDNDATNPGRVDENGAPIPAAPAGTGAEGPYVNQVRYVYQRVEVLAVDKQLPADLGQSEAEEVGAAGNLGLITLAIPPEALQVLLAVGSENLYLSLLPSTYVPAPLPAPDFGDLLPGEEADKLTPYWNLPAQDEAEGGADAESSGTVSE